MIRNYITVALRNLSKNRLYTLLNIFGLAIGLAACLLIVIFVNRELSYDRWNPLADRIVRPTIDINFGGLQQHFAVIGSVIGPDCSRELPEVQSSCRFRDYGSNLIRRDGQGLQNFKETNQLWADSTFFELFPLKVLAGDPRTALTRPNTVAISKSRAEKYFGSVQMALGQTLIFDNKDRWTVSAVYEDMPENSHFVAHFLLAMNGNEEVKDSPDAWGANNNFQTYLLLRPNVDKAAFERKFLALSKEKLQITAQKLLGTTLAEIEKTGQFVRFDLQNLPDIHLNSDLYAELAPNGSIKYVWIFSAIALFILIIACINFMNLATARAATRAREVGMRKALGGTRHALIGQFLSESIVLTGISVILALGVAALAMPWFRDLTAQAVEIPWGSAGFWTALTAGTLGVGFLAGSYPAFFLSAFRSVEVLKGQATGMGKGGGLRSALVVFQFAVSVMLIVSTVLIYKQLSFIQNKKLGYDKSQLLIVDDAYALGDGVYHFRDEMLRNAIFEAGTVSGYLPVPSNRSDYTFSSTRSFEMGKTVDMQRWRVDNDYFKTLEIELSKGRLFDPARVSDSTALILNETAARLFGITDVNDQKIYRPEELKGSESPRPEDFTEFHVIGVVKDFHYSSLRDNIGPLCFQLGKSPGSITFRFKGADASAALASLEKQWKSTAPDQPFNYRFLDDAFSKMYITEQRIGKIAGIFTGLALLVSCLGLFGLATFTIEQRRKEIGIRKVLGASVSGVTGLLARDFLKLVILGVLVASPVAWYFMHYWLSDFAYRIEIPWWIFAAAALAACGIAFVTVSFQSIRAALANPVKSLRNE